VVCALALKVEIQTETQGNKMRTDEELKADLMERLDAIPAVKSSEIEVSVDNGLVTLNGQVDTHQTRFQVERTARRVSGMRGLEIKVRPSQSGPKRSH
jgi:osmotically-inducible protein OsmY